MLPISCNFPFIFYKVVEDKASLPLTQCLWFWVQVWRKIKLGEWVAKKKGSLVAQSVKNLPALQETWVRFLGWEDPLEKKMATQYLCLENFMDRGAWWAAIHGVAKSRVQLSN